MKLTSDSFSAGRSIPERCAFARPDPQEHLQLSDNRNPHLAWSDVPAATKSLALICIDPDVPTSMDDFNQEGRTIPKDLPRTDFVHWIMVDIPPDMREIVEGACSTNVTPGGKQEPKGPQGSRQSLNDYTAFFAHDAEMQGRYFGYDGPCPPWNDARLHHYEFRLYAIDLDRCPVAGEFSVTEVMDAIGGHVLSEATLTGTYSLNPDVPT